MRTSRIAKDTAEVVSALSSERLDRATRVSSRLASRNLVALQEKDGENEPGLERASFSPASSTLLSLQADQEVSIKDFVETRPSKRRKHQAPDTSPARFRRTASITAESGDCKPSKTRRQPAKKVVNDLGEVEIHPPSNWESVYDAVREMRKQVLAPVDTMGCETLAEPQLDPKVSSSPLPCASIGS